jgi:hypothetical protein
MKRIAVVLIAAFAAGALYAQEIVYSGELKTGFYIEQETIGKEEPVADGGMTNTDGDSGIGQGRLRLDFNFSYQTLGLRVRFQIEPTKTQLAPYYPSWGFAYAYGNLFNEQLKISVGILGESPWGTGGPNLLVEPESRQYISYNELSGDLYTASEGLIGIRFEYKPSFIPGLNLGFVLNQPDRTTSDTMEQTFGDVLSESVIGVAYEHDYFAVRVGYRLDSKVDTYNNVNEGGSLTYRLEERVLKNLADGMQLSLNGWYYGIGGDLKEIQEMDGTGKISKKEMGVGEYFINWLYWLWDTDDFTAKCNVGFGIYKAYNNPDFRPFKREEYQSLELKPAFFYKLFYNMFQIGLGLGFGMEFGDGKTYKDSPYQYISIEPQIILNIGSGAYIAAVYNFTDKYVWWDKASMPSIKDDRKEGDKSVKHSINIRAVYTF